MLHNLGSFQAAKHETGRDHEQTYSWADRRPDWLTRSEYRKGGHQPANRGENVRANCGRAKNQIGVTIHTHCRE